MTARTAFAPAIAISCLAALLACPAVAVGNRIYCIGGVGNGKYIDAVEAYDTASDTWRVAPPLPEAKAWAGACAIDGKVYVAGGANHDDKTNVYRWISDLHVYTPRGL